MAQTIVAVYDKATNETAVFVLQEPKFEVDAIVAAYRELAENGYTVTVVDFDDAKMTTGAFQDYLEEQL